MKTKKSYRKPVLKVRKIELGVFGGYGNRLPNSDIEPVSNIRDLDLRME